MKLLSIVLMCSAFVMAHAVADAPKTKSNSTAAKSGTNENSPVLVRVNGQAIREADLEFFKRTRKLTAEDVSERRDVLIERLIERQLLREFLGKKKVAADPGLLNQHLERLKLKLKDRKEDPDQVLAKAGFTDQSLRRELSLPLDWDAYLKTIVTEAKLRQVWSERKNEFDGSEVRAAHIVLKSDKPDDDEQTLKGLREQIVSGRLTFAEAAKKHSQSPDSAKNGGDLGRFGFRGLQPPPFPQVVFGLKVGEVSEPFRSPFGVHLLTVTKRIEGQLSLEDAKPEIFQQLSLEMQQEVLKQERAKAKIEKP